MPQINDCKFEALRAQGYTGDIDAMQYDWGNDNGFPNGMVGTSWYNALIDSGIAPSSINDMAFEFWCNNGGTFGLKALIGWTGLEDCGNLLEYKVDVGTDSVSLFGYRDPNDGVLPFGSMPETAISESLLYAAHVSTATSICQLRFGNGFERLQLRDSITVTWQGYPTITYLWDGTNLDYRVVDAGLASWISSLNDQRVSLEVEYVAIMATLDGTTALQRAVESVGEANEITISLWVWRDSGVNTGQKIYDIGDGIANGNDTTRLRHSAAGTLRSILSNVDGGVYTEMASAGAGAPSTEDSMHHVWMTAKNDLVDGVGTQVMYLYEDGILIDTDITFFPNSSTKVSLVAGDFVTLMARHNLTQFLTGKVADIWSGAKYMDPVTAIPLFRQVSPADAAWNGGVPVDLGVTGVVNGVTPSNWLGGKGYTIAHWNNGVNNGSNGDFTRIGGVIT